MFQKQYLAIDAYKRIKGEGIKDKLVNRPKKSQWLE